MDVTVQNFEAITVASVRHTGPYAECGTAWETLCKNPKVCKTFGPHSKFIGICHDDPNRTEPEKIRYDACVAILAPQEFGGEVVTRTIDAGKYAVYIHKGSFEGLSDTYHKLYEEWLPASEHEGKCAPCLEIYLNDPSTTPPDELLTEIRVPLK